MIININLIQNYLIFCEYGKRLSKHTLKAYRIDLKQFYNYMNHLHITYKSKSVKRKIASLNAFFNYLEYEEQIDENPLHKLHLEFKK